MTLNVVIVDDAADAVDSLAGVLERYCGESGIDCTVSKFGSPIKFLSDYKPVYDIIFLVIDMPTMNAIELAKYIRKMDGEVSIVFVTNMAKYAINGYEVDADDFIVKPVRYGNFKLKLDRVIKKHGSKKNVPYVTVYENGVTKYVQVTDIRYVEVVQHNVIYHMVDGSYEKRGSLKNELSLFTGNGFAQCNKSYLVNLRFVLGIDGYALHLAKARGRLDYEELPIGHPRKKEFVHALNKFLEEHI